MAAFRFSLASVLRLRNRKRDECRRVLARAVEQLEELEARNQRVLDEQKELSSLLKQQSQSGKIDIDLISRCQMHISELGRLYQQNLLECERARNAVAQCRAQLVVADQQVKALEKLEDKQRDEFRREQAKQDLEEQEDVLAAHRLRKPLL